MSKLSPLLALCVTFGWGCVDSSPSYPIIPSNNAADMGDMKVTPTPDLGPLPDLGFDMKMGPCTPGAEDSPDESAQDTNCDGVDGDASRSIFVATYGDDANIGTKIAPKRTINAAILAAKGDDSKSWVLVENGLYDEQVILSEGVHVVGGYVFGWRRDPRSYTTIRGGKPAISGENIMQPTILMNLDVQPAQDVARSESIITISLTNSSGVILKKMLVTAGTAGDGQPGIAGMAGATGTTGRPGQDGREDSGGLCSSKGQPSAAEGASSSCGGQPGGKGGLSARGGGTGQTGSPGSGGASGGNGGGKGSQGGTGGEGGPGAPGMPGEGGSSAGAFQALTWTGQAGKDGSPGLPGQSGGGGGGGGGGDSGCDSWGGTGGGGGAGGCSGQAGTGGQAGGASVAIFLLDSDIIIEDSKIILGVGGRGGDGGAGGKGGDGGPGGVGGRREDDSGPGGPGGKGGLGGQGGAGGGGAGGPAFGVYSNVMLMTAPLNVEYVQGSGGVGGNGLGANGRGAQGAQVEYQIGPLD